MSSNANIIGNGNVQPSIIILSHGKLAKELINSTSMIFGNMENIYALSLNVGDDPDDYMRGLESLLNSVSEDSLVMVDIFGGTPCNSLLRLAKERKIYAVSGANMPMLLEAANMRDSFSGQELLEHIVETGNRCVINITDLINRHSS